MIIDSYGRNSSCTVSLLSTFNQFFVVLLMICICFLAKYMLSATICWFAWFVIIFLVFVVIDLWFIMIDLGSLCIALFFLCDKFCIVVQFKTFGL
jgi:hypothetical protein